MQKEVMIEEAENDNKWLLVKDYEEKNKTKLSKKEIVKNILKVFAVIIFPFILQIMIELLNSKILMLEGVMDLSSIGTFFASIGKAIGLIFEYSFANKWNNVIIIIGLLIGIYAITGKIKRSMVLTTVVTLALLIVNYTLVQMRGTPITPADFYSISLLLNMTSGIKIEFSTLILIPILTMTLYLIMIFKLKLPNINDKKITITRIVSGVLCLAIFVIFISTNLLDAELSYNTKEFYEKNGLVASFLTTVKEMKVQEPEGYSKESTISGLKEILGDEYKEEDNAIAVNSDANKENPNIIVIMNESLTDIENVYGMKLSEDSMPFIHSLSENTIKANVYSSSLGGKTANCEWEFLTGNTSRFLPVGAVPYQQYIKEETNSMVTLLKANGYYTSAYHPYHKEGYNRDLIYKLLGFDEYKFKDSMNDLNMLRYNDYADDLSTYKNIIKLFEEKDEDEKIFNFTVTIQNHLSYDDENFENTVFLADYDKEEYSRINQFLTLMKLSDEAFEYLVEYFEDYDEPTIIMMFGDHQPGFVGEEYAELFGQEEGVYNKQEYVTPLILWANYDIEEKDLGDISMNYLSTILFDVAGVEKDNYMKYLEQLYQKYPVITTNIYKDSNGNFYEYEDIPEDFELYQYLQYYKMFDK